MNVKQAEGGGGGDIEEKWRRVKEREVVLERVET